MPVDSLLLWRAGNTAPVQRWTTRRVFRRGDVHRHHGYLATVGNYLGSEMVAAVKFFPRDGGGNF